jgi:ABC-2 type transport system ATP-binding protein
MTTPAVSIEGLTKDYGSFRALNGISFEVAGGDFVAFLGPNGAGKTTTIHSITGLCNFQSGSVKVFGHDVVKEYRLTRPRIGLCPQEVNLDPFLNIEQVLVYQAGYFGMVRKEAEKRADQLLRHFRLQDKRRQDFRKLSGGMNYLKELNQAGKTIFLTTHYMEEAERLARTVVIVDKGRIVYRGDTKSLTRDESLENVFLRLTRDDEID